MKLQALIALVVPVVCSLATAGPVRLWETNLVIPTYLAAPPSPVPRFYEGRTYQGAKATFYPYPVQDVLTDERTNRTYRALFLENDYLQISVIPELGGRIWSAMDKANGYDFFYRQHVVKPALIGMLGAWISGGVEWNVPHHHRATSFSPVDYTTQTNADGSATIWVGEIELRHRMKWLVGMTLYPDRSYLELTCKVFNRTPFAHPMLFWINAAVHANTNYQVIFPPSTEWAAQHSKPEFASWPIARQVYGGTDYSRGVDISWWKNHPNPVSFFAWNYEDDWFGGYDHGKQAGVIHVADHHVAPGKKFFEWGTGPEGEMWSKILTDEDGPYLELMAGAWSDNQPDYSWIQPGETREWKHWWYPIRNMGGVKAATRDAAVNLVEGAPPWTVELAINVTGEFKNALVRVEAAHNWPLDARLDLAPARPFRTNLSSSSIQRIRVSSAEGVELVRYEVMPSRGSPMPKPVERPKAPRDYANMDELYYTGQRLEQLHNPSFEAVPYYEEMLRRDPGEYRANKAMGILLCREWRWEDAAKYLSNAIIRATANHIRPQDGTALFHAGVAQRNRARQLEAGVTGREPTAKMVTALSAATELFSKAAWDSAWRAAAHFELAEIECQFAHYSRPSGHSSTHALGNNQFWRALDHINASLAFNARNPCALNLKSGILRRLGQFEEARQVANTALVLDPLALRAEVEVALAQSKATSKPSGGGIRMGGTPGLRRSSPEARLELAEEYARGRFLDEAMGVLTEGIDPNQPQNALLCYHLGFYAWLRGDFEEPWRIYRDAFYDPPDFAFPFQHEAARIYQHAADWETDAESVYDAHAPFYLGNLLYDRQPAVAIKAWETARDRIPYPLRSMPPGAARFYALTHRNLALGYAQHEKNIPKAIASLEKAVELNPKEPRFFYELDVQYEAGGTPVARRLEMLTRHHDTVAGRDDALTREIVLLTVAGRPERALALLRGRHFRNWEGSSQIHNVYVDACLAHGQQLAAEKKSREALAAYQAALEYPENLEVGKARRSPRTAQIQYLIGTAHAALGDAAAAKSAFEKAAAGRDRGATESSYFHALALQKLDRADEAKPIFERLVKAGGEQLTQGEAPDYFAKFGEKTSERVRQANAHYLIGLGQLGLGRRSEAEAAFQKALELHPAHLGSTTALREVAQAK